MTLLCNIGLLLLLSLVIILLTTIALLLSLSIVVACWVTVCYVIIWTCKLQTFTKSYIRMTMKRMMSIMANDIPTFLWCIVAPLLFLLYIFCLLSHIERHDIWTLIFQITLIAD